MYVYKRTEPGLWTVGYHEPNGTWQPESDHKSEEKAAERVHWLNGGHPAVAVYPVAIIGGGWRLNGPGSDPWRDSVWDCLHDAQAAAKCINDRRLTSEGLKAIGRTRGAIAAVNREGR
jgi:hypothetical protein